MLTFDLKQSRASHGLATSIYIYIYINQEIANEIITEINNNKTNHHDHLTIWHTKVTKNKEPSSNGGSFTEFNTKKHTQIQTTKERT